jgi:hypothetical protein
VLAEHRRAEDLDALHVRPPLRKRLEVPHHRVHLGRRPLQMNGSRRDVLHRQSRADDHDRDDRRDEQSNGPDGDLHDSSFIRAALPLHRNAAPPTT